MSLIFTIFALVVFTELIAWIGKPVLLDLVRPRFLLFMGSSRGLPDRRHGASTEA